MREYVEYTGMAPLFANEFDVLGRFFDHVNRRPFAHDTLGGVDYYAPMPFGNGRQQHPPYFLRRVDKLWTVVFIPNSWISFRVSVSLVVSREGDLAAYERDLLLSKFFIP